jgi:GNAT superfamily N-acetyltransferase
VVEVHPVAPDDWIHWRDVRLRALADAPEAFGSSLADWVAADERRWRRRLDDVPFNVVAVSDGLSIGQASGTAADDDGCVELISMWVAPEDRGTGAARVLIDAVMEWARRVAAVGARPSVRRANEHAIRLYLRTGFVQVDEDGEESSELVMVRSLRF